VVREGRYQKTGVSRVRIGERFDDKIAGEESVSMNLGVEPRKGKKTKGTQGAREDKNRRKNQRLRTVRDVGREEWGQKVG